MSLGALPPVRARMLRLRFAAPTPEYVPKGREFKVKLQLCKENGAVPLPPHAAAMQPAVKVTLRTADLDKVPGESILAAQPSSGKRLTLAPDGSCEVVVAVRGCNRLHYSGDTHTTECFHTITCPLFLHCEVSMPPPPPSTAGASAGNTPAIGKKGAKKEKPRKGGGKGGGRKGAVGGAAAASAGPAATVVACVSPAMLIGPAAAELELQESQRMAKQLMALCEPVPGVSPTGAGKGVELVVCER